MSERNTYRTRNKVLAERQVLEDQKEIQEFLYTSPTKEIDDEYLELQQRNLDE